MKIVNILLIAFALLLASCQKQPVASFTTDKTEYYAGDTIHLTNTSENGHSYIWTMPDGSKQTKKDATYIVDKSVLYEKLIFQLEADSKHERKKGFAAKQVLAVLKPIVNESCFFLGTKSICPTVYDFFNPPNLIGGGYPDSFNISIDPELSNYAGIYEIKDSNSQVKGYVAKVRFGHTVPDFQPAGDADYTYNVFSGKMVIYKSNNYWHVIINKAQAIHNKTNQIVNVSANLLYKYY
jgi:hypothetical protein